MESMRIDDGLDCRQALEIVSASLDGEAALSEIDVLTEHLLTCSACRRAAAELESEDDLLRRLPARPVLRASAVRRPPRTGRWLPWLAAAAALLAVLWVSRLSGPPVGTSDPLAEAEGPVAAPAASIDASLDRLMAQADALTSNARPPVPGARANPFRARRSENPFARRTRSAAASPFRRSPFHGRAAASSSESSGT